MTPLSRITEVLPDCHHRLWVTVDGERTLHVALRPSEGPDSLLSLSAGHVFRRAEVTEDGQAVRWPGGFPLSLATLCARQETPWLSHLGDLPARDRYRPLLPLLRHCTPGAYLRAQPERHHLMQALGMKPGELLSIIEAYPVPEALTLHRLHDIALLLRHHLFPDLPAALLRRPWPYAQHRCPKEDLLHTMQGCLLRGRLDLIEDPLWALVRGEVVSD